MHLYRAPLRVVLSEEIIIFIFGTSTISILYTYLFLIITCKMYNVYSVIIITLILFTTCNTQYIVLHFYKFKHNRVHI